MKYVLMITAVVVARVSSSGYYPAYGVTVGINPYSHPVQSLYHAQDVLGQYVYGYSTPTSTKNEAKTADGVTRGGYSYIDSNGILQTVQYIADAVHGFRVAATNLPQDLPDVAYAKAKHLADYEATKAEHASIAAQRSVQYSNPIAVPISAVPQVPLVDLPQPVHDLPEVVKARAEHLAAVEATKVRDAAAYEAEYSARLNSISAQVSGDVAPVTYATGHVTAYRPIAYGSPVSSQYHSQDGYGQYSYGYAGPLSSKSETKTADGVTRGGYSYIDANGVLQTVHYISDPVNGFRVAATNLPVDSGSHVAVAAAPAVVAAKTIAPATLYTHQIVY